MIPELNIKKRISSKVMVGLLILVPATLLSSALAVGAFDHFRKAYRVVREEKIPGLIGASRLIRESEQLAALAPDIMVARNRYIRSLIHGEIVEKEEKIRGLIAPLSRAGIESPLLQDLSGRFDLLFANLKELIRLNNSLEEINTRTRQINIRLHRLSENANGLISEVPGGRAEKGAGAPAPAAGESGGTEPGVRSLAIRLGAVNRAVGDLLSLQTVDALAVLGDVERRFLKRLNMLSSRPFSESFDLNRSIGSMEEEIIRYGTGKGSLFLQRKRRIELRGDIEGNLVDNKFLSERLVNAVAGIFKVIREDMEAGNERVDKRINTVINLLLVIPLVGVLGAVLIFYYIHSSVVGRILGLKAYMDENVAGRSRGVPVLGSDEIADMARSVNFFIGEIEKRERYLENIASQMVTAKDKAEAANRAKSVFLAHMSHELRTPLNAILGFSRMLAKERNLDAGQRKNLAVITAGGEHLLMVINDVLAMSRIEAGRLTLSERNLDLHELLDDIREMFRLRFEEKGVGLFFEVEGEVPRFVRVDGMKLRQVLINLMNNAVKFTREGGISLRIAPGSVEASAPDEQYIRFEVEDTGIGIPEHELETIFESFVGSETPEGQEEGSGLGLPISHRYVELMGGTLGVRSREKQGSVFSFDIKVGVVSESLVREQGRTPRVVGLAPGMPRFRVLVVDDNRENRRLLLAMLEPLELELLEAVNGREAVERARTRGPHLIFMDMRMPVMDGRKATRAIKALSGTEAPIIVAVTASVFEEERDEVLKVGCDDFLRKPFLEEEVFTLLEKHLELRFNYEENEETSEVPRAEAGEYRIDPEIMGRLPRDLLEKLGKAAVAAEMDLVAELIKEIRRYDVSTARMVKRMADDFSYGDIVGLIRRSI